MVDSRMSKIWNHYMLSITYKFKYVKGRMPVFGQLETTRIQFYGESRIDFANLKTIFISFAMLILLK